MTGVNRTQDATIELHDRREPNAGRGVRAERPLRERPKTKFGERGVATYSGIKYNKVLYAAFDDCENRVFGQPAPSPAAIPSPKGKAGSRFFPRFIERAKPPRL